MKSLKSKIIFPLIALGISSMPVLGQDNYEKNDEWNTTIGTCGIYPNDRDLKSRFGSYFGIQAETQKKVKNDFYAAVNGTYGFANYSNEEMNLKARLKEMTVLGLYKLDRLELGFGPKLSLLKVAGEEKIKTLSGTKIEELFDEDFSGIGWEGRAKYKIFDGKKIDLSAMGSYSKVNQDDPTAWPNLGSTKLSFILEF
jgi:hypothetical protein